MLRIGSETCSSGLELSTAKRYWKLVALATGIYSVFGVCLKTTWRRAEKGWEGGGNNSISETK